MYVTTTAKLDAIQHRRLAELSNYYFTVEYRIGRHNADADGLSRRYIFENELKAIYQEALSCAPLATCISENAAPRVSNEEFGAVEAIANVDWKESDAKIWTSLELLTS